MNLSQVCLVLNRFLLKFPVVDHIQVTFWRGGGGGGGQIITYLNNKIYSHSNNYVCQMHRMVKITFFVALNCWCL